MTCGIYKITILGVITTVVNTALTRNMEVRHFHSQPLKKIMYGGKSNA